MDIVSDHSIASLISVILLIKALMIAMCYQDALMSMISEYLNARNAFHFIHCTAFVQLTRASLEDETKLSRI
jgi:hypothetical protein